MDNKTLKQGDEVVVKNGDNFTLISGKYVGKATTGQQVIETSHGIEVIEVDKNLLVLRADHAKLEGLTQIRAIVKRTGLTESEVMDAIKAIK